MLRIERYGSSRFWALYDGPDLVVVTVYKRGACEVLRRQRPPPPPPRPWPWPPRRSRPRSWPSTPGHWHSRPGPAGRAGTRPAGPGGRSGWPPRPAGAPPMPTSSLPSPFSGPAAVGREAGDAALSRLARAPFARHPERSGGLGLDSRSRATRYTCIPPGRAGVCSRHGRSAVQPVPFPAPWGAEVGAKAQRPIERVCSHQGGEEAVPGSPARGGGNPAPHRPVVRQPLPIPALR
jgi:hypothetical protein